MMQPQHLAQGAACALPTATLESHSCRLERAPYAIQPACGKVFARNTRVSLTANPGSNWHEAVSDPSYSDRRLRCQRASHFWPHSALSQPFRPAHPSSKKNTLLSHPSPSRLSQYTQASTSKTCRGQAHAPVLTLTTPRMIPAVWGPSC